MLLSRQYLPTVYHLSSIHCHDHSQSDLTEIFIQLTLIIHDKESYSYIDESTKSDS